ncbi:MAG: hypothetical protein QXU88_02325, partial [Candidatus Woesearchaeota archaeon]
GKMNGTVFVKIEEYKDIVELLGSVREQVAKAKEVLERIERLKEEEDKKLESWRAELAELEQRLDGIDKRLAEARQ